MYTDSSKVTFVPKAPVTNIQKPSSISGAVSEGTTSQGIGFVGWIAVIILISTVIATVGLFMYIGYFQSQQRAIVDNLKQKQEQVDVNFIADAQKLSSRIGYAKDLLHSQVYITPLFEDLHKSTLTTVQFDSFELKEKESQNGRSGAVGTGVFEAILKGKAKSYEVIAQQSEVLHAIPSTKTHFFSDFKVDTLTNLVSFTLTIDLPLRFGHDQFKSVAESNASQNQTEPSRLLDPNVSAPINP